MGPSGTMRPARLVSMCAMSGIIQGLHTTRSVTSSPTSSLSLANALAARCMCKPNIKHLKHCSMSASQSIHDHLVQYPGSPGVHVRHFRRYPGFAHCQLCCLAPHQQLSRADTFAALCKTAVYCQESAGINEHHWARAGSHKNLA